MSQAHKRQVCVGFNRDFLIIIINQIKQENTNQNFLFLVFHSGWFSVFVGFFYHWVPYNLKRQNSREKPGHIYGYILITEFAKITEEYMVLRNFFWADFFQVINMEWLNFTELY